MSHRAGLIAALFLIKIVESLLLSQVLIYEQRWLLLDLLLLCLFLLQRGHFFGIHDPELQFQVNDFTGENGTKRSVSNIRAAELLENDDDRQDFIVQVVLKDAVLEALGPLEVKVDKVVHL